MSIGLLELISISCSSMKVEFIFSSQTAVFHLHLYINLCRIWTGTGPWSFLRA